MSRAKPETKDDGQQLLKNWQLLTCWHFAVGIFKLPHEALRSQKARERERAFMRVLRAAVQDFSSRQDRLLCRC